MSKTLLIILTIAMLGNFAKTGSEESRSGDSHHLPSRVPRPCKCIAATPCPTSSFSHNGDCSCPTIQNGVFEQHYYQTGDIFETGFGERSHTYTVNFPKAFCKVPNVLVAVNYLDSEKGTNQRYRIWADTITATSFAVTFYTFSDTLIYRIGVSYIAFA